ncbi:MAG: hypothetical protein L0H79_15085 [Intrasporangium sp.]|uniref:hypothetical protein n=1 Tax=Intrasporangium sp. TaxID=1925024 RepID=UPI0026471DCC|nr:hypothetical protein [Intrasporangium sp.]MDN5797065.1 hypothetical protein [Intrasporangium sp.]
MTAWSMDALQLCAELPGLIDEPAGDRPATGHALDDVAVGAEQIAGSKLHAAQAPVSVEEPVRGVRVRDHRVAQVHREVMPGLLGVDVVRVGGQERVQLVQGGIV